MSAEKRKVTTDALETLGTIITSGGRDAIHLAVEPVIAGQELFAGDHIGLVSGKAYNITEYDGTHPVRALGIVDPFIKGNIKEGEMFWLVVYPRQITSLRHVWEHPDFPENVVQKDSELAQQVADKLLGVKNSKDYIEELANEVGCSYERLMEVAASNAEGGSDYINTGDNQISLPREFWDHYEKVTGNKVAEQNRYSFFSCSC